jgi:hypothetical protein
MLYAGLDLSRQRLDVHVLDEEGRTVEVTAATPEVFGLRELVARISRHGDEVSAVIESMNGGRFIHDQLELYGWDVEIADAVKVKGLAPLAAKTDRIDAWVLAELARRDLVPAIWLPDPAVRAERERARFRLHLVRHRTALKNRIHATLIAFGHGSRPPRSSPGRPACAPSSASRAAGTTGDRWRATVPSTCAGRSSRRPPTPPVTPSTASGTSTPSDASAASGAARLPGSRSPASSPPPSGTCSPRASPLIPAGPPRVLWSLRRPSTEMDRRTSRSNLVLPVRRR